MTRPLDVARWPPWLRERPGSVSPATEPLSVTFPTTRLVTRVLIALGADPAASPATWQWADITRYVRQDLGISLSVGRPDESGLVQYGRATLKLDNRDGRFTRRNPNSPYYGLLSMNTPIWVTVDAGSGEKTRIEMFVNEWPTRWTDKSANDSTVTIQCSGVLRRLGPDVAVSSPLRRAITGPGMSVEPVAYWPLEGNRATTTGAPSGLVGGPTLVPFGTAAPLLGAIAGPAGSDSMPDFSSKGALQANLPAITNTNQFQFEFWFRTLEGNSTGYTANVPIQVDLTGGTIPAFDVLLFVAQGAGGDGLGTIGFDIATYEASPPSESFRSFNLAIIVHSISNVQGSWRHLRMTFVQVSTTVTLTAYLDEVQIGTASDAPWTFGVPSRIVINPTQSTPGAAAYAGVDGIGISSIGHVLIYDSVGDHGVYVAGTGHAGESATARMVRLCREEGVPFETHGDTS